MFATLITKAAGFLGVKELFVKLGLGVLTLLAIGFAVWRVMVWYDDQLDAAFDRGEKSAYAKVDKRATDLANQLTASANKLKDEANAEHVDTAIAATDLRVRGPGRASCPAPIVATSGGHQPAAAEEANAGPEVSPGDWARVPWSWLVDVVQEHDDLLTEATSWRKDHQEKSEIITAEQK